MLPAPSRPAIHTFWLYVLLLNAVALLALLSWGYLQTRPVALHDLHLAEGEKLKCVSYAPFYRPGQTPFDPELHIGAEQLRADLTALARISECVRIYSTEKGLDQVPEIAREVGLSVILGAWIGADPLINRRALEQAIQLANDNNDVVRMLMVGNEVLLRRDRSLEQLRELLAFAYLRSNVPISYADVWEFWLANPDLAYDVDVVTVHMLPFWENSPVGVDQAIEHVARAHTEVSTAFADLPVMIGETGWPSAGRQRGAARPGPVEQARFVREFVHRAHEQKWDYNLIEAIDQPWKRQLEGTVGGHWGLFDTSLNLKFPLTGPVQARASIEPLLHAAAIGGGLALLLSLGVATGTSGLLRALALTTMGSASGIIAWLGWEHALLAWRTPLEWWLLGGVGAIGLALPLALTRWRDQTLVPEASWHGGHRNLPTLIASLRAAILFAAAVATILLLMDPRYRDFPLWLYLAPALAIGCLSLGGRHTLSLEERLCAAIAALGALLRLLPEPLNAQALGWAGLCLLFSLGVFAKATEDDQQTEQGADGSRLVAVPDQSDQSG